MPHRHAQRRAAKAARRKKLLAERRKIAIAEKQLPRAERMRRMAAAPIHSCLVSDALFEIGNGNLILVRRAADGGMAMAAFMLDVYCVGVKDVTLRQDDSREIERVIAVLGDVQPLIEIDPGRARKLLRDLVSWARSIGLPEERLCRACVTGHYPTPVGQELYHLDVLKSAEGARAACHSNGGGGRTYE